GHAGLEATLPVNRSVGGLTLDEVVLGLKVSDNAMLEALVSGSARLGPVAATITRCGVAFEIHLANGNVGPFTVSTAFRPPSGVGIQIDAGPVSGGGFVAIDTAAGRYSGALNLRIYDIAVSAFGVIDTKLPDGRKGYSFVILISAEFTPIQLGLG